MQSLRVGLVDALLRLREQIGVGQIELVAEGEGLVLLFLLRRTRALLLRRALARFGGLTRLGLRSIARHRTQGAAPVAALAVCLAIPVGVLTARTEAIRTAGRHASIQSGALVVEGDHDTEATSAAEPPMTATTGPDGRMVSTVLLANRRGLVVQINGDLKTAESAAAAARVQEVAGPMTPISIYGLADGTGGWYAGTRTTSAAVVAHQ